MEEAWISGIDWDYQLPENISDKAKKWFAELQDLGNIKIGRCFRRQQLRLRQINLFMYFPLQVKMLMQQSCMKEMYMKIDLYRFPSLPLNPEKHR